jgi:predicted P-loop ATPase
MTDRVLAKFYSKCWKLIDEDLSKDKIFTLIENPENTISYNPIKQFFTKNEHLKPKGNFKTLCECFEISHKIIIDCKSYSVTDYLDVFLKKWLLSIIGSAHGTYSLMILVLNGKQGISKTEFFRNLLPVELREYYAESNLDEGKDSEILMTKKLLIIDDEFGGKSKKDATKLKRLSSQQTFTIRRPYGKVSEDLNRLAVLGGTSNESEVINDPTGNRRILPVNVLNFDLVKYKQIDKTELFMELYHEWQADRTGWFLTTEEIAQLNDATISNQEVMSEEEIIMDLLVVDKSNEMTNTQIKLRLEMKYPSFRTSSKRMGVAMKKCGFESIIKYSEGKTQRVYNVKFKDDNITDMF